MKKLFYPYILVSATLIYSSAFSQNTFPSSGNVGIGTTSPQSILHIAGASGVATMTFNTPGNTKARFGTLSGVPDWIGMFLNANFNGTGWDLDDSSKSGWFFKLDTRSAYDQFAVWKIPSGTGSHTNEYPRLVLQANNKSALGTLYNGYTAAASLDVVSDGSLDILQWRGTATGSVLGAIKANGNIGIGTTSPTTPLTVLASSTDIALFKNASTNNTRIGVANNTGQMNLGIGSTTLHPYLWSSTDKLFIGNDGNPTLFVSGMGNGNVGIGTTNPQGKLAVNGYIYSKKVIVTQLGWSDYVFYHGYRLRPLPEVEKYIQQQQHLPDVPSAADVEKEGIDLGDNQATLLRKIEELTLYVIAQDKKLRSLQRQVQQLKK